MIHARKNASSEGRQWTNYVQNIKLPSVKQDFLRLATLWHCVRIFLFRPCLISHYVTLVDSVILFRGCSRDNEGEGMKVVKGPFVVSTSALPAGSIGGNMSGKMKDQIWQEVCHLPKRPTLYLEMSRYLVNDSFALHPRQ